MNYWSVYVEHDGQVLLQIAHAPLSVCLEALANVLSPLTVHPSSYTDIKLRPKG